jgi:hypothetical protein
MTPVELIQVARAKGIELTADDDKLRVRAPTGALDSDLRNALTRHKPAIIRLLAGPATDHNGPTEHCRICGSPNWWQSNGSPTWHCGHCEPWPQPFTQGRTVVVAGGEWSKH